MSNRALYPIAKFLIYSEFMTTSRVGGSLLLDCAMTEEEAKEKLKMYEERSVEFYKKMPILKNGTTTHVYIPNQPYWWPENRGTT